MPGSPASYIHLACEHELGPEYARWYCPLSNLVSHGFRLGVEWFDHAEPARMLGMHLKHVAGIIAIHTERRNQQSPVNADRVHRRDHIVAGDLIQTLQGSMPRTFGLFRSYACTCESIVENNGLSLLSTPGS